MVIDHPFLDANGPDYRMGPCDHSLCHKGVKHDCPRVRCGERLREHVTMIVANSPRGRRRIVSTEAYRR